MKKIKLLTLISVFATVLAFLTGCVGNSVEAVPPEKVNANEDAAEENTENKIQVSEYGVTVNEKNVAFTDSMNREITISKYPQRVIVLQGSLLEIWNEAGGSAVGKVEDSEDRPEINAIKAETVGTVGSPSMEKILSLEPDLVIIASNHSVQKKLVPVLEQSNIEVIALDIDLLEDYYKAVRIFTAITGREDLYKDHIDTIQNGVEKIIAEVPSDKNYKVAILFATDKGITVRDSGTMVGEMLDDLNTVNISDADYGTTDTKTFSIEKIIQEDPDFIFVQTMGSDTEKIEERLRSDALDNPAWAGLTAVKENRYTVLPKDLYLYKPNQRYPEAYERLAKILYPEIFNQ